MAGCGYVCSLCEGRGVDKDGKACHYCSLPLNSDKEPNSEQEPTNDIH